MKYYLKYHQKKHEFIKRALDQQGWKQTRQNPDFMFFDRVQYLNGKKFAFYEISKDVKATRLIFPHSASPPWWYDGILPVPENVDAILTFGEAQAEATRTFVDVPVHAIGWAWGKVSKFKPVEEPTKILFAPIHPNSKGMGDSRARLNRKVLEALLELPEKYEIEVRHVGHLERQGLFRNRRVSYSSGNTDNKTHNIKRADVVIAEGTFMHLSVAMGKPTIGLYQDTLYNDTPEKIYPQTLADWRHWVEYPVNFGSAPLEELILFVSQNEQTEWREDNIGKAFTPKKFVQLLKKVQDGRL